MKRFSITPAALESMIKGIEKRGQKCDTIVVGSDFAAEMVMHILHDLGRDMHVIADDKLSATRIWVTSADALREFPGGGRN